MKYNTFTVLTSSHRQASKSQHYLFLFMFYSGGNNSANGVVILICFQGGYLFVGMSVVSHHAQLILHMATIMFMQVLTQYKHRVLGIRWNMDKRFLTSHSLASKTLICHLLGLASFLALQKRPRFHNILRANYISIPPVNVYG